MWTYVHIVPTERTNVHIVHVPTKGTYVHIVPTEEQLLLGHESIVYHYHDCENQNMRHIIFLNASAEGTCP